MAGSFSGSISADDNVLPGGMCRNFRELSPGCQAQIARVQDAYKEKFGLAPDIVVRAPGRVNLIGEHTDYNEGFVFPTAIDRQVIIAASASGNDSVFVGSLDYRQEDRFDLNNIQKSTDYLWSNYLRGVLVVLQKRGFKIAGFNALVSGDVPQGAGLSSSAAYEVAVATLCNAMNKFGISGKDTALIAQQAENEFVGVQCGIMDQYISALGEEDSALLIDCRSLAARAVPLNLSKHGCAIVIINSGVQRGLVDSQYNARRQECAHGVKALSKLTGRVMNSLRDIELAEYLSLSDQLDSIVANRCLHVVSENKRVLDAVNALEDADIDRFGQLMYESHLSLKDQFQVSCPEIDTLVDLSRDHSGVVGARITGGGFGGCAVAVVQIDALESYLLKVVPRYESLTGRSASAYVCSSTAGASRIYF